MAKFLIVGCGDLGSKVGNQLVEQGHQVWGLKRNPPTDAISYATENYKTTSVSKIKYIQADLCSQKDIQHLDTDFDQVLYMVTPDGRNEEAYREVYETGINNLLLHFNGHPVNSNISFIFISSTRVYGQQNGEWVDEESATKPASTQGKILLAAEKAFLEHRAQNTVVRFSGIYGRSATPHFMKQNKEDGFQYDPPYYTNRIHYTDCIGFLVYLAQLKCDLESTKLDSLYLVSDDDPAPLWEVANFLWPVSDTTIPFKKTAVQALQNKRCRNNRIKSLGYELLIKTYREGYTV